MKVFCFGLFLPAFCLLVGFVVGQQLDGLTAIAFDGMSVYQAGTEQFNCCSERKAFCGNLDSLDACSALKQCTGEGNECSEGDLPIEDNLLAAEAACDVRTCSGKFQDWCREPSSFDRCKEFHECRTGGIGLDLVSVCGDADGDGPTKFARSWCDDACDDLRELYCEDTADFEVCRLWLSCELLTLPAESIDDEYCVEGVKWWYDGFCAAQNKADDCKGNHDQWCELFQATSNSSIASDGPTLAEACVAYKECMGSEQEEIDDVCGPMAFSMPARSSLDVSFPINHCQCQYFPWTAVLGAVLAVALVPTAAYVGLRALAKSSPPASKVSTDDDNGNKEPAETPVMVAEETPEDASGGEEEED